MSGNGPLEGVLVLDLTRVLSGPFCTLLLADFGARVIKVERPGTGDDSRTYGPFIETSDGKVESGYYLSVNRNKESLAVNLKTERGRQIIKALACKADVFIENFRPGVVQDLGLDWPRLREVNPRLIYASLSGYGQYGPYRDKAAYDIIIQAMSGIMSLTAHPGGTPVRVGVSIGDIIPGLFAAFSIVSALYERQRSGLGQYIDVSMLDCLIASLENAVMRYFVTGKAPEPVGTRHPAIFPADAFRASDGLFIVAIGNEELWRNLCKTIGREDLAEDPRFATNRSRVKNYRDLAVILNDIFAKDTVEGWMRTFGKAGIPASPINTIDKVVSDPHVVARDMIVEIDHPGVGPLKVTGIPVKLSRTPGSVRSHAPTVGEHTAKVLSDMLGYSMEEIEALKEEGVIA